MALLDVTETQAWEIPERVMPAMLSSVRAMIYDRMAEIHGSRHVVRHHTTWGLWDENQGVRSLAHDLCASAAHELFHDRGASFDLHAIYEYAKPKKQRAAPVVARLDKEEFAMKRAALAAYRPGQGSIGYGYASVPELIDAAGSDPREFVIRL